MRRYRDGADALKAMCFGYEPKEIAFFLIEDGIWSDKELDSAIARVNACLNPKKQEFFHFSEIIAISKHTRNFDAVFFACDQMGLSRPVPVSLEEQLMRVESLISEYALLMGDVKREFEHIKIQYAPLEYSGPEVVHFSKQDLEGEICSKK